MAEDTRIDARLTFADLCQAIAAGRIDYTVRDGCYLVKHADSRRLALDLDLDDLPLDFSTRSDLFDRLADEIGVEVY